MDGSVEDVFGRPGLHRAAGVHDEDPVGQAGDDAEVVRDEQQGRARLGQGGLERGQHLGLYGHVECRRGLVGQDHVGSFAMAMAMTARWRMPPENSCG